MKFSEEEQKELENKLDEMAVSAVFAMFRGVDMELQQQTIKTHREFQEKTIKYYSSTKIDNENLTIMKNFFEQGIKIINDIMEEK